MLTIFHYGGYRVSSQGNGATYLLEAGGADAFIQYGDDATQFRQDFDAADAIEDPERSVRRKCELIAEYVYSG